MAVLPILIAPHPSLKRRAEPVQEVDDEIRQLTDDMLETMYDAPGVGLAAPQVDVAKRVIVIDCADDGEAPQPYRMINPELLWTSQDQDTREEGCLSLPDIYADVTRAAACKVAYLDQRGEHHELEAEGLLAVCIQHEIDHLNGVLFVDHLSALKRNMLMRKLAKQQAGKKPNKKASVGA
ncbi:peptide deformylase [Rhodovibrio sodomensis]|uniref:Peptide deformylase n=1 Tax=Rhodovibrio sodomensis TaxID=1088 RepID=A0ABS1DGT6_9PROT|nr:peptide deformylase [Rhodovibrio sodomensis]MBK1669434.1 peptide deformylase [Rhodovibrio sodomensis]